MSRAGGFVRSITDLRVYLHAFRLAHFSAYSHVRQVRTPQPRRRRVVRAERVVPQCRAHHASVPERTSASTR